MPPSMEKKPAKIEQESNILRSLKGSNLAQYIVIGVGTALLVGYQYLPPTAKENVVKIGGFVIAAAGTSSRFYNAIVRKERLDMGDVITELGKPGANPGTVAIRAILNPAEAKQMEIVQPMIEGNLKLHELPEVRSLIDAAVKDATKPKDAPVPPLDMNQKMRDLIAAQTPPSPVVTKGERILDPSWSAPV